MLSNADRRRPRTQMLLLELAKRCEASDVPESCHVNVRCDAADHFQNFSFLLKVRLVQVINHVDAQATETGTISLLTSI
jgi:hypothetical protein